MRTKLQSVPTPIALGTIAVIDAALWTVALPFQFFAHSLLTASTPPSILVPLGILLANGIFLASMALASALTAELLRRGIASRRLFAIPRRFASETPRKFRG